VIEPYGDVALLVTFGSSVDETLSRRAHELCRLVRDARNGTETGWGVPVPGYASVLVPFDPVRLDPADAAERLGRLVAAVHAPDDQPAGPEEVIRVRYGGSDGQDLADVARTTGLSERDVVALHGSVTYLVYMLGFAPGFAYLGTLPAELALPRRAEPRTRVPAGSVAIAGRQTAIYPFETPGGWHLIGSTDVAMWDPATDPPSRLRSGMRVRFVPETS
jgi:KipI family sensor histidine kinase inhibitor